MKKFLLVMLVSFQAQAIDLTKVTYFGELNLGFGKQSTANNESNNSTDLVYGLKGFASYDLEKVKLESGIGWLAYKVKTDLIQGQYSAVTLKTKVPTLYFSPKYKLTDKALVGLNLNYVFDKGVMLSPTENAKVLVGLTGAYSLKDTEKYTVRVATSLERSIDTNNRSITMGLVALQLGFKPHNSQNEPLKANQRLVGEGLVRTEHKITKIILDETLIHFETDSYTLDLKSKALLSELAAFLASNTSIWEGLEITGHTDYRGGEEYNTILSVKRANSVYEVLSDIKLPKDRIIFKGKGRTEPVDNGESYEALAKNRRVELKFYNVSDKDQLMNFIAQLKNKYK